MTLTVAPRTERGKKINALRKEGVLPAVVYGPKDEPIAIRLDQGEFEKIFKIAGESTIITLKGLDEDKEVLVQEVAYDPVYGAPIHADLYAIERGKKLQVNVSLEFVGESPAVKLGGVVTKVAHEIEIESLPRDLPQHIEIDLSTLSGFGMQIHLKDVKLPAGVEALGNPDDVIVVVSEVEEEPETPVESVDMSAIEVEKKGKEESEETAS